MAAHDENVRLSVLAETLGFDVVWIPDERFYRDCYVTLADVAERTTHVALGPCVTDPYSRHPALTAAAIGTVDELADGRAILGIGAGALRLLRDGDDARDRPATAIREAIALIRRLLAGELGDAGRPRSCARSVRSWIFRRARRSRSTSPAAARASWSWRERSPTA